MAGFQEHLAALHERGIRVVAGSVDSRDDASGTVERLGLEFPVLYDLDAHAIADLVGAYVSEDPLHLQPAQFILRPDGRVALACYSSGSVGRLQAQEATEHIEHLQKE